MKASWRGSWGVGSVVGGALAAMAIGCGDDGGGSSTACAGLLVSDGQVCVLGAAISETGFQCPPQMPFEYSGEHDGERWAMCSSEGDLDEEAIDEAMQEAADADDPSDPSDPSDPTDPTDPTDPETGDADSDRVADDADNCVREANPDQSDRDGDGSGDVCDLCPDDADPGCRGVTDPTDPAGGEFGDACEGAQDCASGLCLESDPTAFCTRLCDAESPCAVGQVCVEVGDGTGATFPVCVPEDEVSDPSSDVDGDGVPDIDDNCVEVVNADQQDADRDGLGDACDECLDANSDRICDDEQ